DAACIPEARHGLHEAIIRRINKHGHSRVAVGQQILIDHATNLELPKIHRRTYAKGTGARGVQLKLATARTMRKSGRILQPDKMTLTERCGAGLDADIHPR